MYNTEFLGRNFNGGEVIQLVLKGRGGGWLPFRFVQMVMMHELAHNVQVSTPYGRRGRCRGRSGADRHR